MIELIFKLIPILVTDVINPVLLAAVIFALGSNRPYLNSLTILLGWLTVYMISGIILALGLEAITGYLSNPRPIDYWIGIIVGIALILLGIWLMQRHDAASARQRVASSRRSEEPNR